MPRLLTLAAARTGSVADDDLRDAVSVCAARKKFPWWRERHPDVYGPLVAAD